MSDGSLILNGAVHGGSISSSSGIISIPQPYQLGSYAVLDDCYLASPTKVLGYLDVAPNTSVHGPADILLDASYSAGQLSSLGGTMTIEPGVVVHGTGTIYGGQLVNQGHLIADKTWLHVSAVGLTNTGIMESRGGELDIDVQYRSDQLGTLMNNGGTIQLRGTIMNDGYDLDSSKMPGVTIGGEVVGGTISGNWNLGYDPAFNSVTVNGTINVNAPLALRKVAGNGTLNITSNVGLRGYDAYTYIFAPLDIASGLTVTGNAGLVGAYSVPTTIYGNVVCKSGGSITLTGSSIENQGLILLNQSATVVMSSSVSRNHNSISIAKGAVLSTTGDFVSDANSHLSIVFDQSRITPAFTITGNLDLSAPNDYLDLVGSGTPHTGTLITYTGALNGIFNQVTPGFVVTYDVHSISVREVPEPEGALMLIVVSQAMPWVLRNQRMRSRNECSKITFPVARMTHRQN
jgi:hypothetical protein